MQRAAAQTGGPRLRQQRDRIRDEVRRDERHDADHGEAAANEIDAIEH